MFLADVVIQSLWIVTSEARNDMLHNFYYDMIGDYLGPLKYHAIKKWQINPSKIECFQNRNLQLARSCDAVSYILKDKLLRDDGDAWLDKLWQITPSADFRLSEWKKATDTSRVNLLKIAF